MQLFFESHQTYETIGSMKIFVLFLLMTSAFATSPNEGTQPMSTVTPAKEDNTDLRDQSVVFSIEEVEGKKSWFLERSPSFTNVLRKMDDDKETVRKIDGRVAQTLDRDFASRFLKCQYEIASADGECKVTLRLTMKGENQDICAKDDKKSQEIMTFVEELNKRF